MSGSLGNCLLHKSSDHRSTMATVLVISSSVARGAIGLGGSGFALQRLGHEVVSWPTTVLSNHPGHARHAALPVPASTLDAFLEVYADAGWLTAIDAVLTGYLPSPDHVETAVRVIDQVRRVNPSLVVCCDPVLGDDVSGAAALVAEYGGRLYIDPAAAAAIRNELVPIADILTPNRFELSWLAARAIVTAEDGIAAARDLPALQTLVTSAPHPTSHIANVLITRDGVWRSAHERRPAVPHGTGDVLAGLYLGWLLKGAEPPVALARASAVLAVVAAMSSGADELRLAAITADWTTLTAEAAEHLEV